jgi:hypothetical protein
VTSYDLLADIITNNGAIFMVVVDFNNCDVGDFTMPNMYGGILWETYVVDSPGDGG